MIVYPAIDLMQGRCVRLAGGDFDASTDYGGDPVAVADAYKADGAEWLHVVDLDGARDPAARQADSIAQIVKGTDLKVQTGGGVRSAEDAERLLDLGAARVVIGSLCVRDHAAVAGLLHKHGPEKIVLALDVKGNFRDGFFVVTSGWTQQTKLRIDDLLRSYDGLALHILCTDVAKDGMLSGPNVELYRGLTSLAQHLEFQASGGVAQLSDIPELKRSGTAGVVIGRALYEKKFTLAEALREAA